MRLLTRADFDGLGCAAILKDLGIVNRWEFVNPKDVQDGKIPVTDNDVLANIPYVEGCKMWFDHHASEAERMSTAVPFEGEARLAPSAARIIYEYYGGADKMPHFEEMIKFVDKVDSADLTQEEILNPTGWVLLGFIMDPRTRLDSKKFAISNDQLIEKLMDICRKMSIEQILELPDVKERVNVYFEQESLFKEMLEKYTIVDENLIITDLRGVNPIYTGNRFLIYSIYPEQNASIWIADGQNKEKCTIAVGHSIINHSCNTNVGHLMLKFNGGGHHRVGTTQVPCDEAETVITEIIRYMKSLG
ncbi:MAG: exopolyphosphatase [Defluviitaleaceae bacterium]|nr:exopolyphosphatase [Defluviitaleaceae bacterium]